MSTTLYRHFDSNDNLLYVGISLSAYERFKQHLSQSGWSIQSIKMTMQHYNTREEALIAEKDAIINERPIHNKVHNTKYKGISILDGVYERLDKLATHINNDKNPITVKEEFNRRIKKWMDQYDFIRDSLDAQQWIEYCYNREINPGHSGSSWVDSTPRYDCWKKGSVEWSRFGY